MTAQLHFSSGKCVGATAPEYPSAILTGFLANVAKCYIGKTPEEISIHARKWAEAIRDMPAPSDMPFGWALTQASVRADLETYASEAEAARKEILEHSTLEKVA